MKILPYLFILVCFSYFTYAEIDANVDINKQEFVPGEHLIATLNLNNKFNFQVNIIAEIALKDDLDDVISLLPPLQQTLGALESREIKIFEVDIDDSFDSERYKIVANIIFEGSPVITANSEFLVKDAAKELDFEIYICKDKSCGKKSRVFANNEDIFLDYYSDAGDIELDALLTYPDGTKKEISLPVKIKATEIGTYNIEATAMKEGYRSISKEYSLGVIEAPVTIESVSVCNVNEECDGKENYKNCPQDCISGENDDYCDKELDGKCDPDCNKEEDLDCQEIEFVTLTKQELGDKEEVELEGTKITEKEKNQNLLIAIGFIIVIIISIVLLIRKKKEKKKK